MRPRLLDVDGPPPLQEATRMLEGDVIGPVPTPLAGGYFICGPCNGRATKVVYLGPNLTAHTCDECHEKAERARVSEVQR